MRRRLPQLFNKVFFRFTFGFIGMLVLSFSVFFVIGYVGYQAVAERELLVPYAPADGR